MSYAYRAKVIVDHTKVGSDETNFPILVSGVYDGTGGEPDLRTTVNGGHIQNTVSGGASGSVTIPADLVFSSNTDGSSPYDFEIEKYDAATGEIVAWVELTSLSSSSNTEFYIVYGDVGVTTSQENVSGTWGNGYVGVWHLGEGGGTAYDSAGSNDAADHTSATGTTGKIGDGQEFDGSDDYYDPGGIATIDPDNDFTVTAWGRFANLTGRCYCVTAGISGDFGFTLGYRATEGLGTRLYNSATSTALVALGESGYSTTGAFSYLASTWDASGSVGVFYLDGTSRSDIINVGAGGGSISRETKMGSSPQGDDYFLDGYLDEIRISSVVRDSDWIATQYNTQSSPSTFYTIENGVSARRIFVIT